MSDRFRKLMDKRAGPGGVRNKCGCCGLGKCDHTAVRQEFKRELEKEIEDELWEHNLKHKKN